MAQGTSLKQIPIHLSCGKKKILLFTIRLVYWSRLTTVCIAVSAGEVIKSAWHWFFRTGVL